MCEVSKSSVELHTVDISKPILEASSLASLAESCKKWGFFHITNHGVSSDLYGKIQSMSKDVFTLPLDTKLRLGPCSPTKTYTPQFIASPFFESLKVSGPDFSASAQSSADILFDHHHHHHHSLFSDTLHEYSNKMVELSKRITNVLLMCLGQGFDKKFESEFRDCHGYLRINNYSPPHDHDHDHDSQTMMEGLGMHTDMSCVTILYQDLSGGLQVRSSWEGKDEWVEIRPCEGTLVVNVGDMFQAWSNDRLRSSEHRVVLSRDHHHRFSLAFFWGFPDQKVVVSPQEVVGEHGVRAYEPFLCLDYLRFRENDERGRFDKVAFTVKHFAALPHHNP